MTGGSSPDADLILDWLVDHATRSYPRLAVIPLEMVRKRFSGWGPTGTPA